MSEANEATELVEYVDLGGGVGKWGSYVQNNFGDWYAGEARPLPRHAALALTKGGPKRSGFRVVAAGEPVKLAPATPSAFEDEDSEN